VGVPSVVGAGERRKAARAALERLEETAPVIIGSSEGESDADDGEEGEEESSADEREPEELSAYELERQANIAKNNTELARLGLAGTSRLTGAPASARLSPAARPAPSPAAAASSASGKRARSPSVESAQSDEDEEDEENDDELQSGTANKAQSACSSSRSTAPVAPVSCVVSPNKVEPYFLLLCNGQVGPLRAHNIRAQANSLGLDMEAFSEENTELMIECFDNGGKGGMTLDEFQHLCQMA